ncbi:MAG: hypothetical protein FJ164_00485 [Gammaproteobacteria bacterium]|nr:hypothetical protein [Gammaproteobacteria bacterium]
MSGNPKTGKVNRKRFREKLPLGERILRRLLVPLLLGPFIQRLKPVETEHKLIRLGGDGDGGYLVPDDLAGIQRCFSPGVGPTSAFENSLLERGIPCHLADGTVEGPSFTHSLMTFEKLNLGAQTGDGVVSLADWVNRHAAPGDNDLLLQMDIEGAEYPVLAATDPSLFKRFRIIVMELHQLDQLTNLNGGVVNRRIPRCIEPLLDDFAVVHIHPNNHSPISHVAGYAVSRAMEFTLLRRDRITQSRPARVFPHPLDQPNSLMHPNRVLSECWYA